MSSSSPAEPMVQLAQKYRAEFEQQFDGLRQRSSHLVDDAQQQVQQLQQQASELQSTAMQKKDELMNVLADMSPVENLRSQRVLETFAWTAILEFTYSLGSALCGYVLAPFIGMILGTMPALLLSYAILPYIAYKHVQQQQGSDEQLRFKLLGFASVEGLLVGYVLSDRALSTGGPLMFLTPLLIGVVTQLGDGKFGSRQVLLGATLGSALGLHFLFGLLGGQLSLGYMMLAGMYTAVGFATLQLYLKYQTSSEAAPPHMYQLGHFMASLTAQAVVYFLLGASYESYKKKEDGWSMPSVPNPLNAVKSK